MKFYYLPCFDIKYSISFGSWNPIPWSPQFEYPIDEIFWFPKIFASDSFGFLVVAVAVVVVVDDEKADEDEVADANFSNFSSILRFKTIDWRTSVSEDKYSGIIKTIYNRNE